MFKSLKFESHDSKKNQYLYTLIDSRFTCVLRGSLTSTVSQTLQVIAAMIIEYQKRKLNVAQGIASFYAKSAHRNTSLQIMVIKNDAALIDIFFPGIEFQKKYLPCVLRQIKQLRFGKQNQT